MLFREEAINPLMAKKRSRRSRRSNFVALNITRQGFALSTLGNVTALTENMIGNLTEDLYCISMDVCVAWEGLTVGEGPILVGFAHGDLSVTEIKESLEAEPTGPDDIIAIERTRRPVRKIGIISPVAASGFLNDGKMIRVKMKFTIPDGKPINFFAYNMDQSAALTTGCILSYNGTLYGRWRI